MRSTMLLMLCALCTDAVAGQTPTRVFAIGGFDIPESMQHEAELDLYFVSNVTAHGSRKDNTGFISRIRPDGTIEQLKFIEGGRRVGWQWAA